jgi:chromate reductase, NAD(P)H dehydrogenase (quinone)
MLLPWLKKLEHKLPILIYDGDLEEKDGLPQLAKDFKELMRSHDGFIISTPEYNGALSGVLKNLIDWVSRSEDGEEGLVVFKKKTALIMSASPGGLGGIRGLPILRLILSGVGTLVIPSQVAFGGAHKGFGDDGTITDDKMKERVNNAVKELVETTTKLS